MRAVLKSQSETRSQRRLQLMKRSACSAQKPSGVHERTLVLRS